MYVQVIEGRTSKPEEIRKREEVWLRDLLPGAEGYLGSTGGATAAGDFIVLARFENRSAAEKNSNRPEQGAWWAETEKLFDGPVTFRDSEDVSVISHGDLDSAKFVQVMGGSVTDRAKVADLEREADPILAELRPDLLGSVIVYFPDNTFTQVAYFTSEADARAGEGRPMPDEVGAKFAEWESLMNVDRYLDITEPWLVSA
ncbi:MAG TPA: hypothetical protein VLD86_10865 [Ilumatobacteraceae bacterium]|nr:hypothetical protein [Ilumatobacteraceae bacterium]